MTRAGEEDVVLLDEPAGPGRAEPGRGLGTTDYSGKIYVPDPEQRRGWREYYVQRPVSRRDNVAFGFRKPGQR